MSHCQTRQTRPRNYMTLKTSKKKKPQDVPSGCSCLAGYSGAIAASSAFEMRPIHGFEKNMFLKNNCVQRCSKMDDGCFFLGDFLIAVMCFFLVGKLMTIFFMFLWQAGEL